MPHFPGMIVIWSGSFASIPPGWTLCDGTNGTPDLRDRFIVGAGDTYNPDDTGGASNHNHAFTGDGHQHTIPSVGPVQAGTGFKALTSVDPAAGTTDNSPTLPPFYALAYIMLL